MTRSAFVLAAGLLMLAGAVGASAPTAPEQPAALKAALEVKTEKNVLYDTIEKEKVYLDLAMPKEGGPYPCIVVFHGGAWIGGSRKDLSIGDKGKDGQVVPS